MALKTTVPVDVSAEALGGLLAAIGGKMLVGGKPLAAFCGRSAETVNWLATTAGAAGVLTYFALDIARALRG